MISDVHSFVFHRFDRVDCEREQVDETPLWNKKLKTLDAKLYPIQQVINAVLYARMFPEFTKWKTPAP